MGTIRAPGRRPRSDRTPTFIVGGHTVLVLAHDHVRGVSRGRQHLKEVVRLAVSIESIAERTRHRRPIQFDGLLGVARRERGRSRDRGRRWPRAAGDSSPIRHRHCMQSHSTSARSTASCHRARRACLHPETCRERESGHDRPGSSAPQEPRGHDRLTSQPKPVAVRFRAGPASEAGERRRVRRKAFAAGRSHAADLIGVRGADGLGERIGERGRAALGKRRRLAVSIEAHIRIAGHVGPVEANGARVALSRRVRLAGGMPRAGRGPRRVRIVLAAAENAPLNVERHVAVRVDLPARHRAAEGVLEDSKDLINVVVIDVSEPVDDRTRPRVGPVEGDATVLVGRHQMRGRACQAGMTRRFQSTGIQERGTQRRVAGSKRSRASIGAWRASGDRDKHSSYAGGSVYAREGV